MSLVGKDLRLVVHHVGGRLGNRAFPDMGKFERDLVNVLYEADEDCIEQIRAANVARDSELHVLPVCLGAKSGAEGTLHVNYDPFTSSLRPFDPAYAGFYYFDHDHDYLFGEAFGTVETRAVKLESLDALVHGARARVPAPNFLSVDTQGSELEILHGAVQALKTDVVAAVVEVEFQPLYKGQPLFGDLCAFMGERGFQFVKFLHYREIAPYRAPIGLRALGFHLFDDALFLRRYQDIEALDASVAERWLLLRKLAFVAIVFRQLEYALQCFNGARRLAATSPLDGEQLPGYLAFLSGLEARAAAVPAERPRSFAQKYSFAQSSARFKPQWSRNPVEVPLIIPKAEQRTLSDVERYLVEHGFTGLAEDVRSRRLIQNHIRKYIDAHPGFDEKNMIVGVAVRYE